MARQIDLPPVVHALASLRATITAAERDAPTELLAQIRASSDATLAAIVEVCSAEVLGCLHGETRTPLRAVELRLAGRVALWCCMVPEEVCRRLCKVRRLQ